METNCIAKTPAISVVGVSNSGKTTFLVKLIRELKSRGYCVASVKHSSHGFDIDRPGKDSYRHAEAGAEAVALVSPNKIALIKNLEQEMQLSEVIDLIGNSYDIILVEGYKSYPLPKIEIVREGVSPGLLSIENELFAVVTDCEGVLAAGIPHFLLDNTADIADIVEKSFLKKCEL